jgi:hypothetical protein
MLLIVRITLHHIGAKQINLTTHKTKIQLDTLQARRKFVLDRKYPRGIECDDSQTTARLEKGALVVEMPITKLPSVTELQQAAEAEKQATAKAEAAAAAAVEGGKAKGKKKKKREEVQDDDDDEQDGDDGVPMRAADGPDAARPSKKKRRVDSGSGASMEASDARMRELLDDATSAVDQQRAAGVKKMRRIEQAEEEARQKAEAKQAERDQKKQALLSTFRQHQAAEKAAKKAEKKAEKQDAERVARVKAAKSTPAAKKKRVSFSPESIVKGKSR